MNTLTLGILSVLGGYEVLGILAIVLVLFGAKKLPELARGLGTGIKEFKKATSDVTSDLQRVIEDDYEPPSQPRRSQASSSSYEGSGETNDRSDQERKTTASSKDAGHDSTV